MLMSMIKVVGDKELTDSVSYNGVILNKYWHNILLRY